MMRPLSGGRQSLETAEVTGVPSRLHHLSNLLGWNRLYLLSNLPAPFMGVGVALEDDEPQSRSPRHRFRAAVGAEFSQDRVHVKLNRVLADGQPFGDRLVGQP